MRTLIGPGSEGYLDRAKAIVDEIVKEMKDSGSWTISLSDWVQAFDREGLHTPAGRTGGLIRNKLQSDKDGDGGYKLHDLLQAVERAHKALTEKENPQPGVSRANEHGPLPPLGPIGQDDPPPTLGDSEAETTLLDMNFEGGLNLSASNIDSMDTAEITKMTGSFRVVVTKLG